MPGAKKVRFASPPVLSPMSHDELDDYEAAEAAARAAYDDDETAAITARDEERGSAYDDDDDDDDDAETAPKAELGSVAALVLIALSAFGFSAQALIVKFLTRSDPVPPMEIVFFRGCFQFAGCCCLLGLYPPMCRSPSRWFGDSCVEMRWLGLRGLVGFGGIAFSFQAVSLLGIAEVQVVQTSTPVLAAIYARVLLGEPWLRLEQCAAVVASIGVALQFGGHQQTHGSDHAAGLAFALAGAASAGGVYVLVRYLGTVVKVDWPILMLYQACGQMLLAFPAHIALRGGAIRTVFSQRSVLLLLACGAMGFLSQILMTRGMQRVKSASASIARLSGLPWSFLFQAVFTSDPVRGRTVAGALIVVASMGFVVHAARLKSAQAPPGKVLVELPTYAKVRADGDDEYCGDSD